jgi:hypothetical protein
MVRPPDDIEEREPVLGGVPTPRRQPSRRRGEPPEPRSLDAAIDRIRQLAVRNDDEVVPGDRFVE